MLRTKNFTPLFNTPHFESLLCDRGGVDRSNHLRILETFLFPKRGIILIDKIGEVVSIETNDYPWDKPLYTKKAFLEEGEQEPFAPLPRISSIINRLKNIPKIPYLLGGTILEPTFMDLPLAGNEFVDRHKHLFGIDCSGLIYLVTEGNVPRNTTDLMKIGKRVETLAPLDLILFTGHVLVYLGNGQVVESRQVDGVVYSDWSIRKTQITLPYQFIRFHPEAFSQRFAQDERCEY